jgi:hypothetical protein
MFSARKRQGNGCEGCSGCPVKDKKQ